jgi:hypothetical protein
MEKFPGTPAGVLGAAINGKLTEIRLKHRKVAVGGDADADGKLDLSAESLDK